MDIAVSRLAELTTQEKTHLALSRLAAQSAQETHDGAGKTIYIYLYYIYIPVYIYIYREREIDRQTDRYIDR